MGPQYSPYTHTPRDADIDLSVEAIEKIAFNFPACSDERVQLLRAVDLIRGDGFGIAYRRWGCSIPTSKGL